MRNLHQSWVNLTISCHSTDLNFTAYNSECVSLFEWFFFCSLFCSLQLNYLNFDPPALQRPAASISFAPKICTAYILREKKVPFYGFIVIYCCDDVIGFVEMLERRHLGDGRGIGSALSPLS